MSVLKKAAPRHDDSGAVMEQVDLERLDRTVALARRWRSQPPRLVVHTVAGSGLDDADALDEYCRFDHVGLLLFPITVAAGIHDLAGAGLAPAPVIPSVVVRDRLARRYLCGLHEGEPSVTRLALHGSRPPVELFLLPRCADGYSSDMAAAERAAGYEEHVALSMGLADTGRVARVFAALAAHPGLEWEGGGHNPHESEHGSTVMYFVARSASVSPVRRLELHALGDHRGVLDRHPVDASRIAATYASWAAR